MGAVVQWGRDAMLINEQWSFEEALYHISRTYRPGGITTGPLRNRQIEAWGQLVGRTRALTELDAAIVRHRSMAAFGRMYSITPQTLKSLRQFFEDLPDDHVRGSIYAGLQLGQWRLVGRLGSGGNAEVWRGKDAASRSAAIKILKRTRGAALKRFTNEIMILQRLQGLRGIVPLVDCVRLEQIREVEYAWLALPVARPLQDAIAENTTTADILRGMGHIAATLTELHDQEITHRDLKPENMYILEDEWVISDFGIASFPNKESLTVANQKLGPLHYIAPEMLQNADRADAKKADVYSLAKTLWVLLTGQKYAPPGEQRRDVPALCVSTWVVLTQPDSIDELLERATRYDPEGRPTMSEFRDILAGLVP